MIPFCSINSVVLDDANVNATQPNDNMETNDDMNLKMIFRIKKDKKKAWLAVSYEDTMQINLIACYNKFSSQSQKSRNCLSA